MPSAIRLANVGCIMVAVTLNDTKHSQTDSRLRTQKSCMSAGDDLMADLDDVALLQMVELQQRDDGDRQTQERPDQRGDRDEALAVAVDHVQRPPVQHRVAGE